MYPLLGLLGVGAEVCSHSEVFARLGKEESNEFISVPT